MVIDKTSRGGTEWARDDSLRSVGRRRLAGAEPPDEDLEKKGSSASRRPAEEPFGRGRGKGVGVKNEAGGYERWGGRGSAEGRRRGGYGGKRHGKVRVTARSEPSAVGQLSAPLSSPGFVSDTIYLAVKARQASRAPVPPPSPHPRPPTN